MENRYVLRADVICEPVVRGWYAWSHLVSPGTAALNLANRQLKTLASFVDSPEIHEAAVASPELRGGPFVDLPATKVHEVEHMIAEATTTGRTMIEFADQVKLLTKRCEAIDSTSSLESLYDNVPSLLDGYVEFFFTEMGQVSFRIFESLLYETDLYDEGTQSTHIYSAKDDKRAFAFSTPRPKNEVVVIDRPFRDKIHDLLGRLRLNPMQKHEIDSELINLGLATDLLDPFIEEKQQPLEKNPPKSGSWRYFGHACVLVTAHNGTNILVDPLIPHKSSNVGPARFSFSDLPDQIDYLLITHNHADHVVLESLLPLRHIVKKVCLPANNGGLCDPSLKLFFERIGFRNVSAMNPMDQIVDGSVRLQALPFLGEHGDLDVGSKLAWLIEDTGRSFMFAADSNNLSPKLYQHIRKSTGTVDVLFLGMECVGAPMSWVYGPLLLKPIDRRSDQSRRLNGSDAHRAVSLVDELGCSEVFIYAMGREPWLSFIMSIDDDENTEQISQAKIFIEECRKRSIHSELLFGCKEVLI